MALLQNQQEEISYLPYETLDKSQVTSWSYSVSKREDYSKVKSEYLDFEQAETREIEVGEGDSTYVLQSTYGDKNEAETVAKTALSRIKKDFRKLQLSTIGNPNLIAESLILLSGFKPGISANWVITKVEHSLDSQGFRTQIEGEVYEFRGSMVGSKG